MNNRTDFIFELLPATVTRKNKCFNLVVTKAMEEGEEHVKVGYQHTAKNGATEVLSVADYPVKNNGFVKAMNETIRGMMTQGWQAMGFEVRK